MIYELFCNNYSRGLQKILSAITILYSLDLQRDRKTEMRHRLSIVERNLMPAGGHERTQLRAIRRMAPDANISLIVPADQPPDASIEGVEVNVLR